jgi:serine/threonine protein kinase
MTFHEEAKSFAHHRRQMEMLADQTAVHRKKFEFALSQLRKFSVSLSGVSHPAPLTESETGAFASLKVQLQALRDLIGQNLLQTWSVPTIENPSNYVLDQLHQIFTNFHAAASDLDGVSTTDIDPQALNWRQYNVLDLRAIHASFTQYLKQRELDRNLARAIEARLISCGQALNDEPTAQQLPVRVFSPIPVHYQSWRVNYADFDQIKAIGGGVSAVVFYGRDRRTGAEVAIKKFKFQKLNGSRLQSFQREVAVLATAQHPALLKLVGATDTLPFCIITDWMPNSSLYHDLHRDHRLDQTGKTIAAFDIARGLQFLHATQIVHRDMKSLNVLLDANCRIRICDFGFSRHAGEDSTMNQNIGTPHWMAPEILCHKANYTSKIDIYAYGIVLWELATAQTPYMGMESPQIIQQVVQNDIRPPLPSDLNPAMRDLIAQCWDRNPDVRPNFDEIVRRFSSEVVMFNGANREEFLRHVRESATSSELLSREIESTMKNVVAGKIELRDATRKILQTGMPPDVLEKCWDMLSGVIEKFPPGDTASALSLFIKSSKLGEAAAILRKLPIDSIPSQTMNLFVSEIPTGSEDTDTAIVVAACRNNCADLCVVYATNPNDISLSLDVAAHNGVDLQLRPAVVDRCVQGLGSADSELALSALRCLLSMRDLKRIHFTRLEALAKSSHVSLSSCAYIAIATLAVDGNFPPVETFDRLINIMSDDSRAVQPVLAACRSPGLAARVVEKFEKEPPAPTQNAAALITASAFHEALRPRLAKIAASCAVSGMWGEFDGFLEKLVTKLGS